MRGRQQKQKQEEQRQEERKLSCLAFVRCVLLLAYCVCCDVDVAGRRVFGFLFLSFSFCCCFVGSAVLTFDGAFLFSCWPRGQQRYLGVRAGLEYLLTVTKQDWSWGLLRAFGRLLGCWILGREAVVSLLEVGDEGAMVLLLRQRLSFGF